MNSSVKTRAQGRPGNSGPAAFAFFCPGPQLGNFTKKISFASNTKPSARPAPIQRRGAEGSHDRFLRSPAPSHRPWTLSAGATLPTTTSPYHDHFRRTRKTGTFYFAQNRNFLLCLDREKWTFSRKKVSRRSEKVSLHGVEQTFRSAVNGPPNPPPCAAGRRAARSAERPKKISAAERADQAATAALCLTSLSTPINCFTCSGLKTPSTPLGLKSVKGDS